MWMGFYLKCDHFSVHTNELWLSPTVRGLSGVSVEIHKNWHILVQMTP